ncbi:MAG: AMP-binding protein [Litorilinea sp.]
MNLIDLFAIARTRSPHKPAIEFADGELRSSLTYAELFDRAERLAAGLMARGVRHGDRVAFFLGNRPEFAIAYLAVIRVGAVMVPINLRYRQREITHILQDCMPVLLITEQSQVELLEDAGADDAGDGLPDLMVVEELDAWSTSAVLESSTTEFPRVAADDLAMILYTSGTTGRSKGAMLSHNNVLATVTGLLNAWAWEQNDRLLLCLPLFHTHGLTVGLHCALAMGATVLLRSKYTPGTTIEDLLDKRTTLFFAVPTIYTRLVAELRGQDAVNLRHMRLFCSGSAPLDPETFGEFERLTGHAILERYGMTETGMNLSNLYAGPRVPGTVGVPLPGVRMRIVDGTGAGVAAGEEGELLVAGSNVFGGYWQDTEKTAASFSHDAGGAQWFRTGDLAREDPSTGYVALLGRKHELIISGGFNIYPREIEELLLTCPGIAEAAVVGRPDAEWGECPVAFIVCETPVADEILFSLCRAQLASFKTPKAIFRVESLPRNAMGKLQKHLLGDGNLAS